jgi:PBP1b-binding outer membrane lipoprotein LpoB
MKKLIALFTLVLLATLLVGCSTRDPLSNFMKAANSNISTIETFEAVESEDETGVNALTSQSIQQVSLALTTNQEKIAYIRTLFQDIKLLHAQNIIDANKVKTSWALLKTNAETFKSLELEMSSEDKATLRAARQLIVSERQTIMETRGEVYSLFLELRGKYTLENLDLIISNLEEVKVILEQRAAFITLFGHTVTDVNLIVESYLP